MSKNNKHHKTSSFSLVIKNSNVGTLFLNKSGTARIEGYFKGNISINGDRTYENVIISQVDQEYIEFKETGGEIKIVDSSNSELTGQILQSNHIYGDSDS